MTNRKSTVSLNIALLCDDAKKEEGTGKDILIGVYSGNIALSEVPATVVVCLWLQLKTKGAGDFEKEIRVIDTRGEMLIMGKFEVQVHQEEAGLTSVALNKMPLTLKRSGPLKFQWRSENGRWSTILTTEVLVRPSDEAGPAAAERRPLSRKRRPLSRMK
ncbi:MAG: hypothetical protein HQ502_17235 [Alphaproteobacteria bacterium]|nr:hypothetical protein [Alphaproteobacteria bacterium]